MSNTEFSQSIDNTLMLHNCPKINKLHIHCDSCSEGDPQLTSKIRFATRKYVEELILHYCRIDREDSYPLPKFLVDSDSLVKLELSKCSIGWRPNWSNLKELKLECSFLYGSDISNAVSCSPLLESLELNRCIGFDDVIIASKSLKRLTFVDVQPNSNRDQLEILCPNLEKLAIKISKDSVIAYSQLPSQTIENVLSRSPFLHVLELPNCHCYDRFVIASKSLKRLVLGEIYGTLDFEISCPHLEEVNLYHFVPCDLYPIGDSESGSELLAMKILGQLQHVNLLEIGRWFIKILSALESEGLSSPLLNCKCLTVDGTIFDEFLPGVVCAIRCSPLLEKLVIKFQPDQPRGLLDLNEGRLRNPKNSNETLVNCSVSSLKIVKIIGLSEKDGKHKLVFKFVEFLLKNARMLDRISITLADCGAVFPFEVSKKLLTFQRSFPHTIIELLFSN